MARRGAPTRKDRSSGAALSPTPVGHGPSPSARISLGVWPQALLYPRISRSYISYHSAHTASPSATAYRLRRLGRLRLGSFRAVGTVGIVGGGSVAAAATAARERLISAEQSLLARREWTNS